MDANLMHISYESGILEDPALEPPEGIYQMTVEPEKASDTKDTIIISFKGGGFDCYGLFMGIVLFVGGCMNVYGASLNSTFYPGIIYLCICANPIKCSTKIL